MKKLTKEDKRIMKYMIQALERNREVEIGHEVDEMIDMEMDDTRLNIFVNEDGRVKFIAGAVSEIIDRYDAAIESVMNYFYS